MNMSVANQYDSYGPDNIQHVRQGSVDAMFPTTSCHAITSRSTFVTLLKLVPML